MPDATRGFSPAGAMRVARQAAQVKAAHLPTCLPAMLMQQQREQVQQPQHEAAGEEAAGTSIGAAGVASTAVLATSDRPDERARKQAAPQNLGKLAEPKKLAGRGGLVD